MYMYIYIYIYCILLNFPNVGLLGILEKCNPHTLWAFLTSLSMQPDAGKVQPSHTPGTF